MHITKQTNLGKTIYQDMMEFLINVHILKEKRSVLEVPL